MQDKRFLTLIVLSIFAVISLIYGITAHPKGRAKKAAISQAGNLTPIKVYVAAERRAKRSKFKSWKRNPFVPVGVPASSNLILSGIIWNKEKPKAVIGDALVSKGDKISGNTVLDIQQDRVILTDGAKDFELKLAK